MQRLKILKMPIASVKLKYNKMIYKVTVYTKIIICKIGGGQIDKVQKIRFSVCLLFKFQNGASGERIRQS